MRVPITAVTKRHLLKEQPFDEILAVVAWSTQCLADGVPQPVAPLQAGDRRIETTPEPSGKAPQPKTLGAYPAHTLECPEGRPGGWFQSNFLIVFNVKM